MNLIPIELVSILISIVIIMKYKLNHKFIEWLLKGVRIYLAPTDGDYESLSKIKKEKNSKIKGICRSCQVDEYIAKVKDSNLSELDLIVFLFLTAMVNLTLIELGKFLNFLNVYFQFIRNDIITENSPEMMEEKGLSQKDQDINDNTINVGSSFAFITLIYFFYTLFRSIFRNGWKSYETRIYYLLQISLFILICICLFYFENILFIDYDNICSIINDRFEKIADKAASDQDTKFKQSYSSNICNRNVLKSFYSFIFSFSCALMFRSSTRLAYFDELLRNSTEKLEHIQNTIADQKGNDENISDASANKSSEGGLKGINHILTLCQFKRIVNILILLLLIDPLLRNYIVDNKFFSEVTFNLALIFPLIVGEFILGLFIIKYYSVLFLNQNYYDIIDFSNNPSKDRLPYLRNKMNYVNTKFWEIFIQLFYIMFLNIILILLYINRSNVLGVGILKKEEFKFRQNFLDTLIYFQLVAIASAKSIFSNIYTYYLQNFSREKKVLFV